MSRLTWRDFYFPRKSPTIIRPPQHGVRATIKAAVRRILCCAEEEEWVEAAPCVRVHDPHCFDTNEGSEADNDETPRTTLDILRAYGPLDRPWTPSPLC